MVERFGGDVAQGQGMILPLLGVVERPVTDFWLRLIVLRLLVLRADVLRPLLYGHYHIGLY